MTSASPKIRDSAQLLPDRFVRTGRRDVPWVHAFAPGVVLATLLLGALNGCGLPSDECAAAEFRCDGRVAMTCEFRETGEGTYHGWRAEDCGTSSCQVDGATAFCALGSEPEPRCKGASSPYCAGSTLTRCEGGFVTGTYDCATGATSGDVFFTSAWNPNTPLCADRGNDTACSDQP